jgi:hypothetical protein
VRLARGGRLGVRPAREAMVRRASREGGNKEGISTSGYESGFLEETANL